MQLTDIEPKKSTIVAEKHGIKLCNDNGQWKIIVRKHTYNYISSSWAKNRYAHFIDVFERRL